MWARVLLVALTAAPWQALAQNRPLPKSDGGVADGGVGAPDASVTLVLERHELRIALAERDAAEARLEVERLKKENAELKERTGVLERKATRLDSVDSISAQLDKVSQQLSAMKSQLDDVSTRLADDRAERQTAERQKSERRAQSDVATASLRIADQNLASGSTADVDNALRLAESSFTPAAVAYLRLARQALTNRDLSAARAYLALAVIENQTIR